MKTQTNGTTTDERDDERDDEGEEGRRRGMSPEIRAMHQIERIMDGLPGDVACRVIEWAGRRWVDGMAERGLKPFRPDAG